MVKSPLYWVILLLIGLGQHSTKGENVQYVKRKIEARLQENAVKDLAYRVLGNDKASGFTLKVSPGLRGLGDRDVANIQSSQDSSGRVTINISGSSGVAVAWGLHHYLKYFCEAHISWQTSQLNLPFPLPSANITLTANDKFRYYQNVCTPGYSFVWWQWSDWEKHIDWMALMGINLPLAFTGQEAIWQRVWLQLGLTEKDLVEHFAGPAFLPWGRMGNLRGWGGPLSNSWMKHQLQLQHKILARMRELGMTPVLSAFAGQVPNGFVKLHPNSSYTHQNWQNFNATYSGVYLLSPMDPLFSRIGALFINEQAKEFGTNHFYNCDTFNEMRPPNNSVEYLRQVGKAVFSAMETADEFSVWVMQGWLFLDKEFWGDDQTKALLTTVPQGRMLLLDLDSTDREQYTRTNSYYGQPFIFNMINTFGGQLALFGRTDNINQRPFQARQISNSTMVGTGFTPEGIHNSYVMFDLLGEMSWRPKPIMDMDHWFQQYSRRRYGAGNIFVEKAWKILSHTVYNSTIRNVHGKVLVIRPPQLGIKDLIWYDLTELISAWELFIAASFDPDLARQETFLFDLVDITRQALANISPTWYYRAEKAYRAGRPELVHENGLVFLSALTDMEQILKTNKHFLLGNWLEAAKAIATNRFERRQYEFNARNQITLWGPDGQILDYGGKQWAGLISDYYIPRWVLFFERLVTSLQTGTKFNKEKFKEEFLIKLGRPFCKATKTYTTEPEGDTIQIARELYLKWKAALLLSHNNY